MNLTLKRDSRIPVYKQIAEQIKDKIQSEELTGGYKLPSERQLAEELSVHRNTIIKAYNWLIEQQLVTASRKRPKGYFVKEPSSRQEFGKRFFPLEKAFQYEFRSAERRFNNLFWQGEATGVINFGGLTMDRTLDQVDAMGDAVDKIFDSSELNMNSFYQERDRLKANICKILSRRNLVATPKNVELLAETNQGVSYLVTLYLREGDCVVAEEPMVPDIYNIFYNRGVRVITVPMDEKGMKMEELEGVLRKEKPKFIYTQPNFHNPTGITMSIGRRKDLLRLAYIYNVPIIEEDYQSDFYYGGKRYPSIYTLDTNKMVIYLDSFTLIFPYMMKIGYAVGPSDFADMLGYALCVDETASGSVSQYFLNAYIDSGQYYSHGERVRSVYGQRLELMCKELDAIRHKGIRYHKPDGGLLVWCTLDEGINERNFCKMAAERGVLVMPGGVFYEKHPARECHIRLSFSNVTEQEISRGVKILGEVLDQCRNQSE